MGRLQFSLVTLLGLTAFVAIGVAALNYATEIWAEVIFSATLLLLLVALLSAAFRREAIRAFWIGFAIAGCLYMLLVFGPGFSSGVGPRLITSAGLRLLEGEQTQAAQTGQVIMMSSSVSGTFVQSGTNRNLWVTTAAPTGSNWSAAGAVDTAFPSPFQTIGHSLLIWPLGLIAGWVAWWIASRSHAGGKRKDPQKALASEANSP